MQLHKGILRWITQSPEFFLQYLPSFQGMLLGDGWQKVPNSHSQNQSDSISNSQKKGGENRYSNTNNVSTT